MSEFTPEKYWPLGSTVQRTTDLSDTDFYRHFGIISVNPINGHTVMIYRKGEKHVYCTANIYIRHSPDGGITWGEDELVKSEGANYDLRGVGGGYDSTGKLFIFYTKCGITDPLVFYANYVIYSTEDGSPGSWSSPPLQLYGQQLSKYLPYGHIVDAGNGVLYQSWYENDYTGLPSQGGNLYTCSYRLNLYKSTNGGDSFSAVNIMSHTNDNENFLYTEFSMVNIGGGCFIVLARKDGLDFQEYHQYKSEDNCNSWYDHGNTSFETLTGNYPAPPWLSFINFEGVGIVACYYTNRGTQKMNVVYGLAKDLLENGPSGWNGNTIKEIFDFWYPQNPPAQYTASGYQSFYQPLNQYKGIGVGFKESGTYLAYPIVVFTNISDMKDVLIELGL